MNIVHTEASWGWGGQEIRILTESAEFIKRGHDVTLVADPRSTIAKRSANYGVPLLPTTLRAKRLPDLIAVRAALKKLKPDVVVCHSSTDHWLTATARITMHPKPAIVRARHVSAEINNLLTTKWLYRKGCEGCLTTSSSIQNAIIRQGLGSLNNVVCIPTGIHPKDAKGYHAARADLGISGGVFVISIVATLRSWKGHDDLLMALSILKSSQVLLLIAGDGPQRAVLEKRALELGLNQQVRFLGQVTDVYRVLCASDVFSLPSYANEGVPQAILQAMACGVPIVSCPTGGIPEALSGYPSKYLAPSRSPRVLAKAFDKLLEEFNQTPLDKNLDRTPFEKYTVQGMYDQCLDFYRASLARYGTLRTKR